MNRMMSLILATTFIGATFDTGAAEASEEMVKAESLFTAKEARRLVFRAKTSQGAALDDVALPRETLDLLLQVAAGQKYYGAIAYAPDAGVMAQTTVAAANYHDIEAARLAARAGCDAQREAGQTPCQIAVDILPKGYEEGRPLTLSMDASEAVRRGDFRKAKGTKALAISPSTGNWGWAASESEAIKACRASNSDADGKDCFLILRD